MANSEESDSQESTDVGTTGSIDQDTLAIAKPRRYRNKDHHRYVVQQACLICGRKPSDPHDLRYAQPRVLGCKASDEFTFPLCRDHHRAVHRVGNERLWWKAAGIDLLSAARTLWTQTLLNEGRMDPDRAPEGAITVPALKECDADSQVTA